MPPRILIADDQADIRESLRLLLKSEGFNVDTAGTPGAVLAAVETAPPDLLLIDMNYGQDTTSGQEGLALLDRLRSVEPQFPVVVMTAWGSIELAVEAMGRAGLHPEALGERPELRLWPTAPRNRPAAVPRPPCRPAGGRSPCQAAGLPP